jgi:tetratricopeptide (TPR) repeat protein
LKPTSRQTKTIEHAFIQGQQAIQMRLWDVAQNHFKSILAISPMHVPALAYLAFVFSSTQQHENAIKTLKTLLMTGQNLAQSHFNLGGEYFKLEQYEQAITHYQTCIKLNPNVIDAYIDCAICQRKLKQYELAERSLHQTLNKDKSNARALQNLGLTYADKEDFNRALNCLEDAVGLAPNEVEFRMSFANVLTKAGLFEEAEKQWFAACNINPNHSDCFVGFGEFLLDLNAFDEAQECFVRALNLSPKSLRVLDDMGENYRHMGNLEKSLACYDQSLTLEPGRLKSLSGKANVLLEHGKLAEVALLADTMVNRYPYEDAGYIIKARSKKSTVGDGIAESLLNFTKLENKDSQAFIHFMLGKVFDDRNDYSNAFKHYAQGNAMRDSLLDYTQAEDLQRFDNIIEFYNETFFAKTRDIGCNSDFPVFIVGMPRSSTTLTEQIISSHPNVMAAGEVGFWNKAKDSMSRTLNVTTEYPQCVLDMEQVDSIKIASLYEGILKKITGKSTGILHITDKMPHNFLHIGLITTIFPNAKIIHTKRDPIDTCLSIFFQNFSDWHSYGFNLSNLGFHYRQYERLMAHWHKLLPGRILDINYEDTTANPELWSRRLIDYVGLEWSDACLAPHKLERSVKTASIWQVRQPIYKSSIERWRNYEEFLGPLIDALKD